jgi:hypothetical protein
MHTVIRAGLIAFCVAVVLPVPFSRGPVAQQAPAAAPDPELQALIRKTNAYVGLMNRTLRAIDSWNRYLSWVNPKTGPTGKERIIYGLYSLYDVRDEISKAKAEIAASPALPQLDASVGRYIATYETLAPLIGQAEGYYERKDYLADKMVEGRDIHQKLAPAAIAFVSARENLEAEMKVVKTDLERRELATIERAEGRKARWHVRNVMIAIRPVVDLLPSGDKPVVDLSVFDKAVAEYASAVREFDKFASENPSSFSVFESQPRNYLGKVREFRQKLDRTKGDARRAGVGHELTWLINDFNMMVSTSSSAIRFSR